MRFIHQHLMSVAPRFSQSDRKVLLALALTPFLSCALPVCGQSTQVRSAASTQTPEQCNYTTDQDQRPEATNASAEAAAAANTYALPELKAGKTSAGEQNVECKPEDGKSTSPSAPPTAAPAPTPAVPLVAYSNGLLTITAHNASFSDVMNAIKARTGVTVESPAGFPDDRVFDEIGPAPVREVLMAFLDGSRFNYVMQGSSSDPRIVRRLILMPRTGGSTMLANQTRTVVPQEVGAYGGVPADSGQQFEAQPEPVAATPVVNPLPPSVGKTLREEAAALQAANPQMTRGEILAEMQKRNDQRLDQEADQSETQAPQPPPQ